MNFLKSVEATIGPGSPIWCCLRSEWNLFTEPLSGYELLSSRHVEPHETESRPGVLSRWRAPAESNILSLEILKHETDYTVWVWSAKIGFLAANWLDQPKAVDFLYTLRAALDGDYVDPIGNVTTPIPLLTRTIARDLLIVTLEFEPPRNITTRDFLDVWCSPGDWLIADLYLRGYRKIMLTTDCNVSIVLERSQTIVRVVLTLLDTGERLEEPFSSMKQAMDFVRRFINVLRATLSPIGGSDFRDICLWLSALACWKCSASDTDQNRT